MWLSKKLTTKSLNYSKIYSYVTFKKFLQTIFNVACKYTKKFFPAWTAIFLFELEDQSFCKDFNNDTLFTLTELSIFGLVKDFGRKDIEFFKHSEYKHC